MYTIYTAIGLSHKTGLKRIKYNFYAESFNTKIFWTTEATLNFEMQAYNLMSLFIYAILVTKVQHFMKTLRYKVFAIGTYMIKDVNTRIIELSLATRMVYRFMEFITNNALPIYCSNLKI